MVRNKKEKGITLIAVVVTVIVLLILATISIGILKGDNGTLTQSKTAKESAEVLEEKKILNIAVEEAMEKNTFGKVEKDNLDAALKNNVGEGNYNIELEVDQFKVTFTESGRYYWVDKDGDIEYLGIVLIEVKEKTVNSIKVNVTATSKEGMPESPVYEYYIKKTSEDSYPSTAEYTGTNSSYTFDNLIQDTSYDIKVITKDNKGNIIKGKITETTGEMPGGGAITFGGPEWSGGQASVTISTTYTDYKIEYQINDIEEGNWKTIENGGAVSGLLHGDTVYARLTDDGLNKSRDYASIDIKDLIGPTVEVTTSNITSKSITANVTATDNEMGMSENAVYEYYIKKTSEDDYEKKHAGEEQMWTFPDLEQDTSYDIKVTTTDIVGNTGEGTALNITTGTVPNEIEGTIIFGTPTWNEGKASVTISTTYTDYTIEYQINDITGTWTTIEDGGTISNLNNEDTIYARLTDGVNHGDYASITITDSIGPIVNVVASTTTKSITANVIATDNETGMPTSPEYKYYIKKSTESSYPSTATYTGTNSSYTFDNLIQDTSYDIKVTTTDRVGNIGVGTALNIITGTVPSGAIVFGTPTWSGGKASVTISTTKTDYTIEYQINSAEGTWTTIANGGAVSNLSNGDTVYARLTDGVNHGEYASVTISDGVAPTISSFTVNIYGTSSIAVKVTAVDNETGIANYQYQYKKSTATTYTTATTTTSTTYTYTGLTDGTTYNLRVIVTDNAGNSSTKDLTQATVVANNAPTFTTQGYAYSKTTSSITIRAIATDADGDKLTYKLYTGTSSSSLSLASTSSSTSSGTAVSLTKSSLSEYKRYYFRMDVTDGTATTTGNVSSVRTYCSGTTSTCTTKLCSSGYSTDCSKCDGEGYIYTTCSTCGGTGKIACPDSPTRTNGDTKMNCPVCGEYTCWYETYKCYTCGVTGWSKWCSTCNKTVALTNNHPSSKITCTTCSGKGYTSRTKCSSCSGTGTKTVKCSHGYTYSHRYCDHYSNTTKTSHSCCSHGHTSQHD